MRKIKNVSLVILASLLFTGCASNNASNNNNSSDNTTSQNSNNELNSNDSANESTSTSINSINSSETPSSTGWTNSEKAIFSEYFYGVEVPFYYIDGSGLLTYESSTSAAYKMGGTSSIELLTNYAKLFDDSWDDYSSTSDEDVESYGFYYAFMKETKTSEGNRYVYVSFGGTSTDEDGYLSLSDDGSGEFYMSIYDPYYYEWPAEMVNYYTKDYFETDEVVPAFNDAELYELNTDYASLGMFAVYAYTDDSSSLTKYGKTLMEAGYISKGLSDGYQVYVSPKGTLQIEIAYDDEYKDLDIWVVLGDGETGGGESGGTGETGTENPLGGTDLLKIETFGISTSGNGYQDGTYVSSKTGAKYVINAYGSNGNIQLKSKDNESGLVSTLSGGTLKTVSVGWNSVTASKASNTTATQAALTVQVYASNTQFTIADMYNGKISQVGSIVYRDNQTSYTFDSSYKYIGLRSENGAINLDSITVVWNAPNA